LCQPVSDERKVVWILGAGFSVPLGGPLFKRLISRESLRALGSWLDFVTQKHFAYIPDGDSAGKHYVDASITAELVCELYVMGLGKDEFDPGRLWNDAEEFLERLEIAIEPHDLLTTGIHEMLGKIRGSHPHASLAIESFQGKHGMHKLRDEAIRFVAGACSIFLDRPEGRHAIVDDSEQWEPYRHWITQLKPGCDAVVTFNYDRSLDMLASYLARKHRTDLLVSPVGDDPDHLEALRPFCVPMYHLHGHVGWRLDPNRKTIVPGTTDSRGVRANFPVAHKNPGEAVIGIPGAFKLDLSLRLLKELWGAAMKAIAEADAVVFVGYRFPPTDNMAKRRILNALRVKPESIVHVVLGSGSRDAARVRGMIEWTRDRVRNPVRVHEMGTEDFFPAFYRDGLFG
jgi:hypothetical protein